MENQSQAIQGGVGNRPMQPSDIPALSTFIVVLRCAYEDSTGQRLPERDVVERVAAHAVEESPTTAVLTFKAMYWDYKHQRPLPYIVRAFRSWLEYREELPESAKAIITSSLILPPAGAFGSH